MSSSYPRADPVLEISSLTKHYPLFERGLLLKRQTGVVHAVDSVTLTVNRGETLGLVGESGSGKSTLAKCVVDLETPTKGLIMFDGVDVLKIFRSRNKKGILALHRQMQYIFQNPYASLDPRMTVADIIMEPLMVHKHIPRDRWISTMYELLKMVGLEEYHAERYPHEFSGGQRQRVCIARALAVEPNLIIADEPVASLDVSIRAQILNLLKDIQSKLGLTYLYISHDLSTVQHMCDRVAVMYLGKIVEIADTAELFSNSLHPYTRALLSAIPIPDPRKKIERIVLPGEVPSPIDPPSGCRFHPRCPRRIDMCSQVEPRLVEVLPRHWLACYNPWPADRPGTPSPPVVETASSAS
jgi:oligopeptide transport system ATP-binding protein